MSAYGTRYVAGPDDYQGSDAPRRYAGSHVIPADSDEQAGWVEFGAIPNHVLAHHAGEPGGAEDDDEILRTYKCKYARLGVSEEAPGNGSTVVLNETQIRELRDALTIWLEEDISW